MSSEKEKASIGKVEKACRRAGRTELLILECIAVAGRICSPH